jgi:LAGLIDADG endonuclease
MYKDSKRSLGWRINIVFLIGLHKKDIELLKLIQAYFGGIGKISKLTKDAYVFRVYTLGEIMKIIDHFDKYPLITKKYADYLLWREVIMIMLRKEHLTQKGLLAIVSLRASLNLGLSISLKKAFPNIIPAIRHQVDNISIPHGEWLAGFCSGEGCFYVFVSKSPTHVSGFKVQLVFIITQHSRDKMLMQSLISYLGCGKLITSSDDKVQFRVEKFLDSYEKVQGFFCNYKIKGVKLEDFKDWCIVAKLMKNQEHLTLKGLAKIVKIKSGMNKGRV